MTAPIAHGAPDWSTPQVATDVILQPRTQVVNDPSTIYGPYFVGFSPYIGVRILMDPGQGAEFIFDFYGDESASLASHIDGHDIVLQTGGFFGGTVRSLGPWMTVVSNPRGLSTGYLWTLYSASVGGMTMNDSSANILVQQGGLAIGAGATANFTATRLWPGRAFLQTKLLAGAHSVLLQALNLSGGAATFFARTYVAGDGAHDMVHLPAKQVQLSFINPGGASFLDAYLVGDAGSMVSGG